MPELPDVEVFRKYFESTALHKTVTTVEVYSKDILDGISGKQLQSRIQGREFATTHRHGKYFFAQLQNDGWAVFHFGMTGYFSYCAHESSLPEHTRVLFIFEDESHLCFVLQRKLGKISMTQDIDFFVEKHEMGPDVLDENFDLETFKKLIKNSRGSVKSALMKQERMAGIGNIYSDEILFHARLSPTTPINLLNDQLVKKLFQSMKIVLQTAIERQADPRKMPSDYLLPHRGKNGRCPVCHGEIKKKNVSGRTSYYCPSCQG